MDSLRIAGSLQRNEMVLEPVSGWGGDMGGLRAVSCGGARYDRDSLVVEAGLT